MTSLLPNLKDLRDAGLEMTWFRSAGAPQAAPPRIVRCHNADFVRFDLPDPMNPFSD